MSTSAPMPYKVKAIKHERRFATDGTMGGQYHVTIEHNGGVESTLTVPETPDAATAVHQAAMVQVNTTKQIANLPASRA